MQKKWIKLGVYLAILCGFFVLFGFSDAIMLQGRGPAVAQGLPGPALEEGYTAVEELARFTDIYQTVEVKGWAFLPTDQDNAGKTLALYFRSEGGACYQLTPEICDRWDVKKAYDQEGAQGVRHGFLARFSPLSMKNGVYRLYIQDVENDAVEGLLDTGVDYEKTDREFKVLVQPS